MIIKVCGVRTAEVAEAAVRAGADWIGLVFAAASPRYADDAAAMAVRAAVAGRADLVGVFVEPTAALCNRIADRYSLAAVERFEKPTVAGVHHAPAFGKHPRVATAFDRRAHLQRRGERRQSERNRNLRTFLQQFEGGRKKQRKQMRHFVRTRARHDQNAVVGRTRFRIGLRFQ